MRHVHSETRSEAVGELRRIPASLNWDQLGPNPVVVGGTACKRLILWWPGTESVSPRSLEKHKLLILKIDTKAEKAWKDSRWYTWVHALWPGMPRRQGGGHPPSACPWTPTGDRGISESPPLAAYSWPENRTSVASASSASARIAR